MTNSILQSFLVLFLFLFSVRAAGIPVVPVIQLIVNDDLIDHLGEPSTAMMEGQYLTQSLDVSRAEVRVLNKNEPAIECRFWSDTSKVNSPYSDGGAGRTIGRGSIAYLSPPFDDQHPLELLAGEGVETGEGEAFLGAEQILCLTPREGAVVFLEDAWKGTLMRSIYIDGRFNPWSPPRFYVEHNEWRKVAVVDASDPRTVCEINLRNQESIFVRVGEDFIFEDSVDISVINCYVDWRGDHLT